MARSEDERSIVPRPKGGPMQSRRFFIGGNPIIGAGKLLSRAEAAPAVQVTRMVVQMVEDPTKAAKAIEITGDLAVNIVNAFTHKPDTNELAMEPQKAPEPEPVAPKWQLDLKQAVDYLNNVNFSLPSRPQRPWDQDVVNGIRDVAVSIGEAGGDIYPVIERFQQHGLTRTSLTVLRAAGDFEKAYELIGNRFVSFFGNMTEDVKYLAKAGKKEEALELLERLEQSSGYPVPWNYVVSPTHLADMATAHYYTGTGDYKKWMGEAEKSMSKLRASDDAQKFREALVKTAIECRDPLKAFEYVNFAKASIKDVVLTNISASYDVLMDLLRNSTDFNVDGHTTLEYMDVFARLGIENLDRFKGASGEITGGESYRRYHNGGVKVFFHLMKEFADSQGVYSDYNFWHSQQAMTEGILGRHIPTITSNRIHWIRVQRMLGRDVEHNTDLLHNVLKDAWTYPFDRAQPNFVLAEGYRMAIEMQTDVGDVDNARVTFAKMDEHLAGDHTDYLLAKADAMARIGIAQKKKELAAA